MKNISTRSLNAPNGNIQGSGYLISQPHERTRGLQWWYRLTAPSEPERSASFKEMERFLAVEGQEARSFWPSTFCSLLPSLLALSGPTSTCFLSSSDHFLC